MRKIAFGTEVPFRSVAASVNDVAASRRPGTSVEAVLESHTPETSPFAASVGNPEKSGSSGTCFRESIAAATPDRASSEDAKVVEANATRFPRATRTPSPASWRSSPTFGTSSSMYTDRVVKAIAKASAASAPAARALRTASDARSRRSTSAAPDDNLAPHVRASRGDGYVVLLALAAAPALELQFPRDHVDALPDRERVARQRHPAHARADLPFRIRQPLCVTAW